MRKPAKTLKEQLVIPVIEEKVVVDKVTSITGEISVLKTVDRVAEKVSVDLDSETVHIDRVAVNQYVEAAPPVRHDGDTTIISVVKEVVVVQKKLMLVEEIHIRKDQQTKTHREEISLRQERIEVRRSPE